VAVLDEPALAVEGLRPQLRLHQLVGAVGPQTTGLGRVGQIVGQDVVAQVPDEPRVLDGEEEISTRRSRLRDMRSALPR
jgi:hypothetical protein